MKWFILFLSALLASAELIPADRLVDWTPGTMTGVPGGIINRTTVYTNVVDAGADNSGVADCSAIVQACINACESNQVVYFPTGVYRMDTGVSIGTKSYITVRGEGTNTIINFNGVSGACFYIGSDNNYLWNSRIIPEVADYYVVAGMDKGSTNIVLNAVLPSYVGALTQITESNSTEVVSVYGYERAKRQMTRIVAVDGTNVTIWPPLYWTLSTNLFPVYSCALPTSMCQFSGVESLTVQATNSLSNAATFMMSQAYGCWFKDLYTSWPANQGFGLSTSLNCEVRRCWIHTAKNYNSSNHAGYGIGASSGCLVEDNIAYRIFPMISVTDGSSGNVIGYNFLEDNSAVGVMGAAIDANHAPHNHHNLYEGNVASKFQSDGFYGSASDDTVLRNWLHGTCPGMTDNSQCINLNRFSRNYSAVGNVLGTTNLIWITNNIFNGQLDGYGYADRYIYTFGLPNMGSGGYNGLRGPPWSDAVISGGSITCTVSNDVIALASSALFDATNADHYLTFPHDNNRAYISSVLNSTQLVLSSALAETNQYFVISPGSGGYQEIDTNVLESSLMKGNFNWSTMNVPANESTGGDTVPDSLYYTNKPTWFGSTPDGIELVGYGRYLGPVSGWTLTGEGIPNNISFYYDGSGLNTATSIATNLQSGYYHVYFEYLTDGGFFSTYADSEQIFVTDYGETGTFSTNIFINSSIAFVMDGDDGEGGYRWTSMGNISIKLINDLSWPAFDTSAPLTVSNRIPAQLRWTGDYYNPVLPTPPAPIGLKMKLRAP